MHMFITVVGCLNHHHDTVLIIDVLFKHRL